VEFKRKQGYTHWRTLRLIRTELIGVPFVFGTISGLTAFLTELKLVPSLLVGFGVSAILLAVISVRVDDFVSDRDYELTQPELINKRYRKLKSEIERSAPPGSMTMPSGLTSAKIGRASCRERV